MAAGKRLQGIARIAGRLRPRYSIRRLLILTAAIGAAIAWWMHGATYTGREFDVAIIGDGYFMVMDDHNGSPTYGQMLFTRDGHLALKDGGQLCISRDSTLWPFALPVWIQRDCTRITIDPGGRIYIDTAASKRIEVGMIQLASVSATGAASIPGHDAILKLTSGPFVINCPGDHGMGRLRQGLIGTGWEKLIPPLIAVGIAALVYGLFKRRWMRSPKFRPEPG
jgi:hypothetical protein